MSIRDCSVCLEEVTSKDRYVTLCNHLFHKACIKTWIEYCRVPPRCPLCREKLVCFGYLFNITGTVFEETDMCDDDTDDDMFGYSDSRYGISYC